MSRFFRIVGNTVWACALCLSVWLAFELHEYHFDISLGVALLSLVLSAFGLLLARFAGKQGDRLAMRVGLAIWLTGAISFGLTELGFWYGSYKDRHAEYTQIKASKTRQEGMKDMAWDALKTGEVRTTSAELQAKIKGARQSEFWASSGGCENATTPKSRAFCQNYFEIEGKLAAAQKLESIEASFLAEKADAKRKAVHSVFAAADMLAENTTVLTERQASVIVILVIALVLMLSRDLLPIVANPIGSPTVARTAAKAPEATTPAVTLPSPAVAPSRTPLAHLEKVAGVMVPKLTEPVSNPYTLAEPVKEIPKTEHAISPDPTGPGTPAPMPEAPKIEEVAESSRNVLSFFRDDGKGPEAPRGKKKAHKPEGKVESWLGTATTQVDDPNVKVNSEACWKSYLSYCDDTGKHPLHRKVFSRQLGVLLGRKTGKTRKRDKNGSVFTGLMINPIMTQTARRKVA